MKLGTAIVPMATQIHAGLFVSSGAEPAQFAKAEFTDYYLRSRNIRLLENLTGTIRLRAVDERLNLNHTTLFETSGDMSMWIPEEGEISQISSTRRELRLERPVGNAPSQFFRIRRIEGSPVP